MKISSHPIDEKQRKTLADTIVKAFANARYPGRAIGDSHEVSAFIKKKWQDITPYDLSENSAAINFFTRQGLAYYLPAYLIAVLKHPGMLSGEVKHNLVSKLADDELLKIDSHGKQFCNYFSRRQRESIILFLESVEYSDFYILSSEGLSLPPETLSYIEQDRDTFNGLLKNAAQCWKACDEEK